MYTCVYLCILMYTYVCTMYTLYIGIQVYIHMFLTCILLGPNDGGKLPPFPAASIHTCMYVCMYVCVYVCMYACVCTLEGKFLLFPPSIYTCKYVCVYVCMNPCMCVCVYVCVRVCVNISLFVSNYVCIYV